MSLPQDLIGALENQLNKDFNLKHIDQNAKEISQKYRANNNDGKRLLTKSDEAVAYALSRMPATYEAIYSSIKKITENNQFNINIVSDIGAGTGAATWAVYELLGKKQFYCLEREHAMIQIGKNLMNHSESLKSVNWKQFDILKDNIEIKSDLCIISYMINELPKNDVKKVIEKLWDATNEVILIIEPGTPRGFENIKYIRELLIEKSGYIIAPCSHENKCELEENDWCHFTCRIQRSKIHKKLKNGQSSYEDEKFSYIAFSKKSIKKCNNRILRHPIINKGYSEFKICTNNGIKNVKISKKDGKIYKMAKKQNCGDCLKFE